MKTLHTLLGGMPRGGTTLAAKFLSLHPEVFCYAGETHLLPLLHDLCGHAPCLPENADRVIAFLHAQLSQTLLEMPRFSVSRGAHPANLIFDDSSLATLMDTVERAIRGGLWGSDLYRTALDALTALIGGGDPRPLLGEKTPGNIFPMREYGPVEGSRYVVIVRDPVGALKSMFVRTQNEKDVYAAAFSPHVFRNIGLYVEYAKAIAPIVGQPGVTVLSYETIATNPAAALTTLWGIFGFIPDARTIAFVEGAPDNGLADRAPMRYRRLSFSPTFDGMSQADLWLTLTLTRGVRDALGYSDEHMRGLGYQLPGDWPGASPDGTIAPLAGFYPDGMTFRRRASIVVYLPWRDACELRLSVSGVVPPVFGGDAVTLAARVDGSERGCVSAPGGDGAMPDLVFTLEPEHLTPMGATGACALIDLEASREYTPLSHLPGGVDARVRAFRLATAEARHGGRRIVLFPPSSAVS
ncbi:MAG: sulfotransferase [Nitrospinae bacterium]|nr:sulfotransferase [Nitrospinota bacterium]